jgi:hypothetical protein
MFIFLGIVFLIVFFNSAFLTLFKSCEFNCALSVLFNCGFGGQRLEVPNCCNAKIATAVIEVVSCIQARTRNIRI